MQALSIQFHHDSIDVIKNGVAWVNIFSVSKAIGIDPNTQRSKLQADPTYEAKLIKIQTAGGMQEVFCIPLDKLNGWLFSINPNKVKPEVREKLIVYKNECFRALNDYFNKGAAFKPEVKMGLESHVYQLRRENVELKRAINRITKDSTEKLSPDAAQFLLDLIGQVAKSIDESTRIETIMRKRREKTQRFLDVFVRAMNHPGITEQSMRKSDAF